MAKTNAGATSLDARSGELMSIPLSLLDASPRNARKTDGRDVSDLKATIKAQGVLHNLIVCPQEGSGKRRGKAPSSREQRYEVVGGLRRLRALRELATEGELDANEPILCRVKPNREAAEASLVENVARQAMLGRAFELSCLSFDGHWYGSIYRGTLFDARQGKLALARVGRPVVAPDNSRSCRPSSLLSREALRTIHCLTTWMNVRATEDTDGQNHSSGRGPPGHTGRPADPCVGTDDHHRAGVLLPARSGDDPRPLARR
jgi:ParB family chromosome partitioning protein